MTDCRGTEYQNMDLDDLFDLRDSRLVRAQINTIDGGTNTASITLLDQCPELDGVTLDAVEFFYHCEWSKGTTRDLRYGYKAFEEEDFVYCLFTPSSGPDDEAVAYIVGHIDIHASIICSQELRAVCSEMPEQLPQWVPLEGYAYPHESWTEDYTMQERKMARCASSSLFLDVFPDTILNVRYPHVEVVDEVETTVGYTSLTVVNGINKDAGWDDYYRMTRNVIVERISSQYDVNEVLRLRFFEDEHDELRVHASMSRDLQSVYVIKRRGNGILAIGKMNWETAYFVYTFNQTTGLWALTKRGTVPLPAAPNNIPCDFCFVDRDGNIGGGWDPRPYSIGETLYIPATGQITGSWNIVTETWDTTQGDVAWIGPVANDEFSDFAMVKGYQTSAKSWDNTGYPTYPYAYDGLYFLQDGWAWTSGGQASYGDGGTIWPVSFTVRKDGVQIDEMHIAGVMKSTSASGDCRAMRVTFGGILCAHTWTMPEREKANSEWMPYPSIPVPFSINRYSIVQPVALDVARENRNLDGSGIDSSFSRSFTAIDEESRQAITGILVALPNAPTQRAWRIYRNGVEVTSWVAECLAKDPDGYPIDQLMGMYWRA